MATNDIDSSIWGKMNQGDGGIVFDDRAFRADLTKLLKKLTPKGVKQGLGQAGLQLMTDAIDLPPKVPLDEGTLQGSGSVLVGNKLVDTSRQRASAGGNPKPLTRLSGMEKPGEHIATVVFNTVYAERLHEHPGYEFQRQKGGEGGKFLEYKLYAYGQRYYGIVAHWINRIFKEGLR